MGDADIDDLLAALTLEEQTLLLKLHAVKQEVEKRKAEIQVTPITTPNSPVQLHRSKNVQVSHNGRHHHTTEEHAAPRKPLHSQIHLDTNIAAQISDPSPQVEQDHSVSSPHPSLPPRLLTSQSPQVSSPTDWLSKKPGIQRKPLPSSPQHHYSPSSAIPEPQQPQLKEQRQDSGYFSASSTPLTPSVPDSQKFYPPPPAYVASPADHWQPTPAAGQGQAQGPQTYQPLLWAAYQPETKDTQFISMPSAPAIDTEKDYFNQAAAPVDAVPQYSVPSPSVSNQGHGVLSMNHWQWGAEKTTPAPVAANAQAGAVWEPDYGPPPPIPTPWKNS